MLLPVTLSCDKNNPNGNIRAYFKKVRCDTATFGHLALIVLLWICPNSKKETKYETVHERNSFNKEIGKLVKDFVLIDTNSPSFSAKTVARFKTNQWRKNGVSAPRETMGGKFRVNINFLPILIPTTVVSEKQGPLVVYFLSYRQLKTFWETSSWYICSLTEWEVRTEEIFDPRSWLTDRVQRDQRVWA